jgi:hypothetical protein
LISISANFNAQQQNSLLEFFSNQQINSEINKSDHILHTGFKPIIPSKLIEFNISDSLEYFTQRDHIFHEKLKSRWIYRKLRNENFVEIHSGPFILNVNPLLNLELKKDNAGTENMFTNTRGIELKGSIGKKMYYYTSFYENQARFEPYVTDYIREHLVVPGQGAPKFLDDNKFDYSMAVAYIFLNFGKHFDLQFGNSKQFIGEGYRSIILSDNSFNYPFLKIAGTYRKFQYTIMWSQHQGFSGSYYNYHFRKFNVISYLSWIPKSGFEIALIESIEWPGNTPDKNNISINYFNPLILWRSVQFGLNDEKNVLLGLNTKIKLYDFAQLFGQFALDNLDSKLSSQNNFAFQLGIKHFDLFHHHLSKQKLFVHLEYNYIAPYTYAYHEVSQSFTHYNQPLTHPAGTGLKEILGIINYSFKDFSLHVRSSFLINSLDTSNTNFGSDVFKPNSISAGIISGNRPGQGIKNQVVQIMPEISFLVNPASNMQLFAKMIYRKIKNSVKSEENIIFSFGFRTNLNNYYYDF